MEKRIGESCSKFWDYCNLSNVRTKPGENDCYQRKSSSLACLGDDNRKVGWELVMGYLGVMLKNLDFNFRQRGAIM